MELAHTAAVKERSDHSRIISGDAVVLYLAGATLVFHLLTASRYGIFRDELYYLACSEHLDWGYVDQPPLIALIAWVARHVFGDSLLGLRLLPALAAAALVWLSGKITKEMGGGRFAQGLAALAVVVAPVYLILQHWLTMNAFEPLIWMGCAWCIVRAVNRSDPRYWRYQGLIGISPPKVENQRTGPLPQYFADEFGWEEMAQDVGRAFNQLPEDQRRVTAIFANDYGEAGAIDFFGPKYGLPKAISNHQNYWYWGTHGYTGESVIVLGSDGKGDREHFATVEAVGQVSPVYSRLDEHFDILLCRGLKWPFQELWPQIKKWN